MRLLMIENASNDGELLLAMLGDQFPHATVRVEANREAALAHLASHAVDLVLADLSLPDAHGASVIRAVRAAHPCTALLVLPGGIDGALWALAEGAPEHLVKRQRDGPRLATAVVHAMERGLVEQECHRSLQLAEELLDVSEAATCAVDSDGVIVAVNRAWRDFAEHNGGSEHLIGVGVSYLDACDQAAEAAGGLGSADAAIVAQGIREVLAGSLEGLRRDYTCHSPSENRWFEVRVTPAVINNGRGVVITHSGITDMHEIRQSMAHQSLHDRLTDLPNRVMMLDLLEQAMSDADRHSLGMAVTQVDLYRYRRVNDQLGYRGGDAVLVEVAKRLQAALRPGDVLARSSGDEFLVLWRGLDVARSDEAVELSEAMVRALDRPFDTEDVPVLVSANVGVAMREPGQGVDDLLQSADVAMQESKGRGPGHVVLVTDELREATTIRRNLEVDLRLALEGDITQFVLHYQPVVDLTSGKVVGVEALVRWQHPIRGLLSPDQFIPLAESAGFITPLGDWVLDRALRDASVLTRHGRELDIAVNLSVRQLDDQTVGKVRRNLESRGLSPSRLILEVTESALAEDEQATATTLEALSQLGVRVAIDDFGTGFSSLLYLRRYPADILKIDREFVAGIGESADDEAICESITGLAAAVGAKTVGEGVETAAQFAVLRSLGCCHGQGFLWSPAVPLDELAAAFAACDVVPVAAPRSRMPRAPERLSADVCASIARMHGEGASLHTIAAAMNRTVGRHPQGMRWTSGAVARALPDATESAEAAGLPSSE